MEGIMGRIGRYFETLFFSVAKGCLLTALIAGVLATATVLLLTHRLPSTADFTLIVVIVVLAGAFGSAIALIWRMTHIPDLIHAVGQSNDRKHQSGN
jgi:NAD/NADP transhydrogenase beta subunit